MRQLATANIVSRPRNRVIRSLIARLGILGSRRHRSGDRRPADRDRQDLDQRVRETGEW